MNEALSLKKTLLNLSKGKEYVQGNKLVDRLVNITNLGRDIVIKELKQLKSEKKIECKDWYRGEPLGRVLLKLSQELSSSEIRWQEIASSTELSSEDISALLPISSSVSDFSVNDIHILIDGLIRLRSDLTTLENQSRYKISAQYLLGSSKMLDALSWSALKEFGIDPNYFSGPPSYIIVAGPPNPQHVILVENPQSLEAAVEAGCAENIAWVATYGYGLSRAANEFGDQLANIVESHQKLTSLIRIGSPPSIEQLLQHEKIFFWGDLDTEGLKIYWRLKGSIHNLELSALYNPMFLMLQQPGKNHPYHKLTGKESQTPWSCNNVVIQQLINACANRAVDQESVSNELIKKYAGMPFQQI